ncbi:tRNA-intron lyase [Candidatus Woesearchaeota archaeon]|nr:tRNA-intron lyase [Candidatus Woesearchaeota archaeon]
MARTKKKAKKRAKPAEKQSKKAKKKSKAKVDAGEKVDIEIKAAEIEEKQAIPQDSKEDKPKRVVVNGVFTDEGVLTEDCDAARDLWNQSCYGKIIDNGKVQLSMYEALYLVEKGRLKVSDRRNKELDLDGFMKKARKTQPNFWTRYAVYKDMRNRGYIVKTALKFGADFRVYDRGVKPGEDHARWVVYPVHESNVLTWHEFAAKNRVAHSTKKRLMIGIVDEEMDVTFYEIKWIRP